VSLTEFWDNLGGTSNVNSATVYNGQSAGYYTMGGIHTRSKVMTVNPVNIQLPSARAGCGGIDLYMGSFSFINKDQFVALMKSIASSSVGYAFQLALESISPVIAEKTRELQDLIQKMNNFSINSCEQAAALVGGAWPKSDAASKNICSTLGAQRGFFSDAAAAKHGCSSGGERASTNKSLANSDPDIVPVDTNYAWTGLIDSGYFGSGSSINKDLAELFMAMTGTIIVIAPASDNSSSPVTHYPSIIKDNDAITAMLDGGNVKVYKCDETTKCLYPAETNVNITSDQAFNAKVKSMINEMITKIENDTALSNEEIAFLNITSLPLYKILNVHSAYSQTTNLIDMNTYAEVIALDILYVYLKDMLNIAEDASKSLQKADEDKVAEFKKNIELIHVNLRTREESNKNKFDNMITIIERTTMIEQHLSSQFSAKMRDTLKWSKSMEGNYCKK
jgi:conjugative transfer pilus assembly protein TraH